MSRARFGALALLVSLLTLVSAAGLSAQEKQVTSLSHKTMDNGLEVFVAENHATPLVTIMISFRAGAITQRPETAGLFHLYEHLMFDGNSKYKTQGDFMAALNRMGVPNWNGGTSEENVNYYITVPSANLEQGLDFWSIAIREPTFDPAQFEKEKKVVDNEIRGYHTDPEDILSNAVTSRIFNSYPWRKDVSGPERNIDAATLDMMREIQNTFYIPNNAALFIGGDVKPEQGFALAQKQFSMWKKGPTPPAITNPHPQFDKTAKLVYPDESFYNGIGNMTVTFRGPDILSSVQDTYTSDVFLFLIQSPVGRFKQALFNKVKDLYDPEYIDFSYPTARDGGVYDFSTFFLIDPRNPDNTYKRMEDLRKAFLDEMTLIAKDPSKYFTADELELAKTKLSDNNVMAMETAGSFISNLNFWWSTATTDYFLGYEANCRKVSFADISALINKYLLNKPSVTAVRIREDTFNAELTAKAQMLTYGYEQVDPDKAYWWQSR